MAHCWTDRYEVSGLDPVAAVVAEIDRRWPNGVPEEMVDDFEQIARDYLSETCMLDIEHEGEHEFQPTSSIVVTFGPAVPQ